MIDCQNDFETLLNAQKQNKSFFPKLPVLEQTDNLDPVSPKLFNLIFHDML